jgi:DNA repair protein RadC
MHEIIADLPYDDRPRERLLLHGVRTLSEAELVAILLGSGLPGKNAIDLARDLLAGRDFDELGKTDPRVLAKVGGIGPAKAARIAAARELARRAGGDKPGEIPLEECTPDSLGRKLVVRFAHERQEHLGAALLDSRNRLIVEKELFVGTIDHAVVSRRDIIRLMLDLNAVKAILYHNHPSGNPKPSAHDIEFTHEAHLAMHAISAELVDHIIIGRNRYLSMRETSDFQPATSAALRGAATRSA